MSATNDIAALLPAAWETFLAQRQATSQLNSTLEDLLHKIAQVNQEILHAHRGSLGRWGKRLLGLS